MSILNSFKGQDSFIKSSCLAVLFLIFYHLSYFILNAQLSKLTAQCLAKINSLIVLCIGFSFQYRKSNIADHLQQGPSRYFWMRTCTLITWKNTGATLCWYFLIEQVTTSLLCLWWSELLQTDLSFWFHRAVYSQDITEIPERAINC